MRRYRKGTLIGLSLIFTLTVAWASGEDKGAANMILEGGKRGNVPFPHRQHQETLQDCQICHALFPQQAGSIETLKAAGTLKKKQVMNKQCTKCHRSKRKAGEKTGPVACKTCHVRK